MFGRKTKEVAELNDAEIDYVFVLLKSNEIDLFRKNQAEVLDIALDLDGMIFQVVSSLSFIAFNLPESPQKNSKELKGRLVDVLIGKFRKEIKIVHGRARVTIGNVGSNHRMAYSAIFSDLGEILEKFSEISYGQDKEISL